MTLTAHRHGAAARESRNRRATRTTITALDLLSRPASHGVAFVKAGETLLTAYVWMRVCGVERLLAMYDGKVAGVLDEHDILMALSDPERDNSGTLVSAHMSNQFQTVNPGAPAGLVLPLLRKGLSIVVKEGGEVLGLIGKPDYINYIRQQLEH